MSVDVIDSNISVYLFVGSNPGRQNIARQVVEEHIASGTRITSFQVVQEVLNVTTHKMKRPLTGTDGIAFFDTILAPLWRVCPSADLYRRAIEVKVRYRFSFYDSLIIAAAQEGGCTRLLSEDLQNGQTIGTLSIVNPFV